MLSTSQTTFPSSFSVETPLIVALGYAWVNAVLMAAGSEEIDSFFSPSSPASFFGAAGFRAAGLPAAGLACAATIDGASANPAINNNRAMVGELRMVGLLYGQRGGR